MSKYVYPNDPCPCGSGKKYKKCCKGKSDNIEYFQEDSLMKIFNKTKKNARIKHCLYPDNCNCSEKIIGAHSIQNNRILRKIADDGYVYMPLPKGNEWNNIQSKFGRKEATVFTGFCGYHDKTIFQEIEDKEFKKSEEQVFLFIYRAFAKELHAKLEAVNMKKILFSKKPSAFVDRNSIDSFKGMELAVEDLNYDKEVFDCALVNKKYDLLRYIIWEINGTSKFAASGMEAPTTDLKGNKIQDLMDFNNRAAHLYYSIFPEDEKTYVIIACLKRDEEKLKSIFGQLEKLDLRERKNYINNTLPIMSENIVINPTSWENLTEQAKTDFASLFLGRATTLEILGVPYDRLKKPQFDLFKL